MKFTIPIEKFRIDITNLHITTKELEQIGVAFHSAFHSNDDIIEVVGKKRNIKFFLSSFNGMKRKVYLRPQIDTPDYHYLLIITDNR